MMVIGIVLGYKLNESGDNYSLIQDITSIDGNVAYGSIEEVIRFIEGKYVHEIDREEMVDRALTAVVEGLDSYSSYIPPQYLKTVNNNMAGVFFGIGLETILYRGDYYISKIYKNSPAELSGLERFDKILSVNEQVIEEGIQSLSDVVSPEVDSLHIQVLRDDTKELDIVAQKSEIEIAPISLATALDDNVFYIKINTFSDRTYRSFMDSIESFNIQSKDHKLIIDLRGNKGGLISETVNILSQLIVEKNITLVTTRGENQKEESYSSTGNAFFELGNIAVLIDGESASASEILAGAIQDLDRGVIIGSKSFGKGLVQEQYILSNNGAIRLTVAAYFLPSGRCIQKKSKAIETDSISIDTFSSLRYGRILASHDGIIPDITVNTQSRLSNFEKLNIQRWAFGFAMDHRDQPLSFWSDIQSQDHSLEDYFRSSANNVKLDSTQEEYVQFELLRALNDLEVFSDPNLQYSYLQVDPVIDVAIKQLAKEDIFDFTK